MALITCPECGKEISDKSSACIHCGYPIEKDFKFSCDSDNYTYNEELDDRVGKIQGSDLPYNEKVRQIEEIASNEKYWSAYSVLASFMCMSNKDLANLQKAKEYAEKALDCEGANKYLVQANVGMIMADKANIDGKWEEAINCLLNTDYPTAYFTLAVIYDSICKKYPYAPKDDNKAITYYTKYLDAEKEEGYNELQLSALNNLSVIFGSRRNNYVVAAAYAYIYFCYKKSSIAQKNYENYIQHVINENGKIWETNIKTLKRHSDIDPMIKRVNALIENRTNTPYCPKCGSTAIQTGARGYGGFWLHIGANKTVNRCSNCGYTWNPHL